MAGHSHSANIRHRKGAVDAKRAKIFSKLARGIITAVRHGGAEIDTNLKLKYAVEKARAANMPKDNIKRAIQTGSREKGGADFEELTYEGYAPGGVAVLVSSLTDNRNRTASDIKFLFDRGQGNLGTTGSVSFLFDFKSILVAERGERDEDQWTELALDVGADDVELDGELVTLLAPPSAFLQLKQTLEERGVQLASAEMGYVPANTIKIEDKDEARRVLKLIESLDDHDDVQSVYANYEMPDEWIDELAG